MTSPYGPSGGNDPQQPQWGQQPPPGGGYSGTPSGGFPAQNPYGPPDPNQPNQQPQWGQLPPHEQATQQYPQGGGYDPNAQQQNPYAAPQQPQGGYDPTQQVPQGGYDPTQQVQSNPYGMPQQGGQFGQQPQNPYGAPQQGGQYGQQQNPYGQPNPYGQQQNPYAQPDPYGQKPKKSGAVLWVVVALVVLVVAAVGITGFVAPGFFVTKVFDNAQMQKDVVGVLKNDYKIPDVESATCPSEQKVKVGVTFECTAQVGGNEKKIKITVKTADGEYEVGQPAG